ncbi:hypothetical protein BU26DRAFT_503650 [Trematosphaeria pertusa]|uniref:Uncharacterized protein n=1 Tax=Trematosphaeria pertusa TaxID=390896 RepID=A0A6A6IL12_9PLEO|nr:uncharacterized protein BU26DRAFT_503650 [Trematosphaeria pertusa]KAF2251076.1 hypothetical protein BU26DRAFT_503650 [Trematosphaeria pertusa]
MAREADVARSAALRVAAGAHPSRAARSGEARNVTADKAHATRRGVGNGSSVADNKAAQRQRPLWAAPFHYYCSLRAPICRPPRCWERLRRAGPWRRRAGSGGGDRGLLAARFNSTPARFLSAARPLQRPPVSLAHAAVPCRDTVD